MRYTIPFNDQFHWIPMKNHGNLNWYWGLAPVSYVPDFWPPPGAPVVIWQ